MKIRQVTSERPTIYADMNVFRYVSLGELEIPNADEFIWVYSHAHLDELVRGRSTDALGNV
jgi:hypothetical protein